MKLERTRTSFFTMWLDAEDELRFRNADWLQDEQGYCLVYEPGKKRPAYVHRLLMASEITWLSGQKKVPRHRIHIHHKNGVKNDNRKANLKALLDKDHKALHKRQRAQSGKPLKSK